MILLIPASIVLFIIGGLIRNEKVYQFRMKILYTGSAGEGLKFHALLPDYEDMVLSWRPLKVRYWFTKEEAEIIERLPNNWDKNNRERFKLIDQSWKNK
jgi:hypothetical protein